MRGRVGALIEISAGFHPDLTGRENVYLQGAILGMSPRTVETHKYQMMQVLGVDSTPELVKYAIEHRLIAD